VADSEGFVANEAVASLYRKELAPEDWQTLAKAIDDDRIPELAHPLLIDGALMRRNDNPECAPLLVSMLASPKVADKLKDRIAAAQERSASATN
jgi:hypothetical protein